MCERSLARKYTELEERERENSKNWEKATDSSIRLKEDRLLQTVKTDRSGMDSRQKSLVVY